MCNTQCFTLWELQEILTSLKMLESTDLGSMYRRTFFKLYIQVFVNMHIYPQNNDLQFVDEGKRSKLDYAL